MKLFDSRSENLIIKLYAKIVRVEFLAGKVTINASYTDYRTTISFTVPTLYLYHTENVCGELQAVGVYAPQSILRDNRSVPLAYDCERLVAMISHCSEVHLSDEMISIVSCGDEKSMIKMKHFDKRRFHFNYDEACKKDAIENFVAVTTFDTLSEGHVSTKNVDVIRSFYELVYEGKNLEEDSDEY